MLTTFCHSRKNDPVPPRRLLVLGPWHIELAAVRAADVVRVNTNPLTVVSEEPALLAATSKAYAHTPREPGGLLSLELDGLRWLRDLRVCGELLQAIQVPHVDRRAGIHRRVRLLLQASIKRGDGRLDPQDDQIPDGVLVRFGKGLLQARLYGGKCR